MPMNGERTRRRLTSHAADDYDPDISPDGRWIVFRSMRDGGVVYLMPAQGGEARRLNAGFQPRFAPNGQQIAYSLIEESGNSGVWIQSLDGLAKRISSGLAIAGCPVWSPDSRHVLVRGAAKREDTAARNDWWVLTVDGREPARPTGAGKILPSIANGTAGDGCPADWLANRVLLGDGRDLQELETV